MDDKHYWTEYYKNNSEPTDRSTFAEFVLPNLEKNKTLLELGCGNGRDSIYFADNDINVIAIDQAENEVKFLNDFYKKDNLLFVCDDFTDLKNSTNSAIKDNEFDYIYSRFTFHSISEKKEDRTLDWIENNIKTGGCFLLEVRSINDPMFKEGRLLSENENFTTHYRRYLDLNTIVGKLERRNFEIVYKIEDKDLAPYKDDNPYLIRIIAKKK